LGYGLLIGDGIEYDSTTKKLQLYSIASYWWGYVFFSYCNYHHRKAIRILCISF